MEEEENILSEEQLLETETSPAVEEVALEEPLIEEPLAEEPVSEVVEEEIVEPEPVDDFAQLTDDLISAETIDQNDLISNFLQSMEKPVTEVLALVGENIPEMATDVSLEVLNVFPEQVLELSQSIATAFPEIVEDIAAEAAAANPDDINDIVSGMLLGSPAKAADIALSVIEVVPESTAEVTVSMATAAPELATEIAAEIVSQNPDLLGEVASAMFFAVPDQVEETVTSLINLNNDFVSELADESLSFNNISSVVFDTILDIAPESASILTNNLMNSLNEEEAGVFIKNLFEFNADSAAEITQNLITTDISFASSVVQAGSEQFVDFLSESLVANYANEDISQLTFEVAKNDPTFAAKFLNDISQLDNADMASINSSMAMELNQSSQSEFVNVGAKLTAEIGQINIDISGEMIAGMFLLDSNKATSFSAEVANNLSQDLNEQMLLNISNHVVRSDFINEFSTNISLLDDEEFNEISKFKSNDLLMMTNSFVKIDQMNSELQAELGSAFANGFNQGVMEFSSPLSEIRSEALENIEVFKATFNENVDPTRILEMFDVTSRPNAENYLTELDFFNYDMDLESQIDTIAFSSIQEGIRNEYLPVNSENNLGPLALGLNNYTPQYVPENYQAGMSLYEEETITYEEEEYVYQESETINSGDGGYSNAFWNDSSNTLVSSGSTIWYAQNIGNGFPGFSASENFNYVGSNSQETINFYINRDTYSGKFTFNMYGGNDGIDNAKFKNIDSLSFGSGDDTVSLKLGSTEDGYYGSPDLSSFNMSLLDGGPGSDTLDFSSSVVTSGATLNLTTGNATNFENIVGSSVNEALQGDANANSLKGNGGLDTIYGYDGSDYLYGYGEAGLGSSGASSQSGNDILYGGGGNDYLFGTAGDNTLDGGTGTDTIYSGSGADSIILRTGDGSTTLSSVNILTDFTDGSDVFLMDDFNSSQITIAQGIGSNEDHTLISITSTGEYLMKILNTLVAKITGADLSTTSTDPLTLNGSSGNDILIGGSGSDTFSGAAGSDEIYGHGGDDSITISGKSGSYTDTILGGSGTDSLSIAYSGITSLKNFTISTSGSTTSLVDSSGGTINFSSIENLTVNSRSYNDATDTPINSGDGGISNAYWGSNEKLIVSTGNTVWYAQNLNTFNTNNFTDYSASDDLEYHGSSNQETINLYINRDSITGDFTFNMGGGNDSISNAKVKNSDSIDMGSGDDRLLLKIGATEDGLWGSPNIGSLNVSNMDGGTGTDTLSFEQSKIADGTTLSLTSGGASNFENLTGSSANETLNGDSNNNTLDGGSGNDTLDGKAGTDTLTGGGGADVFVLRANDGSTSLSSADTITDYIDNTDSFGMAGGLGFSDLTISQGTGSYSSDALIMITSSSEYLGIITNTTATDLTTDDFAAV